MKIREETTSVPLSQRELELISEMANQFLLDFPEATDVETLATKIAVYAQTGVFE